VSDDPSERGLTDPPSVCEDAGLTELWLRVYDDASERVCDDGELAEPSSVYDDVDKDRLSVIGLVLLFAFGLEASVLVRRFDGDEGMVCGFRCWIGELAYGVWTCGRRDKWSQK
jgi:hypothetical protein